MPPDRSRTSRPGRGFYVSAFLLVALILVGCADQYPQSTLHPDSGFARDLADLFRDIFWWAVPVFLIVEGLLLFILFRYRDRGEPGRARDVHGNTGLEIGWTLAPAVILVFIAVPTIEMIFERDRPPADADALTIEVVGHQWWWEFRYPEVGVVTANEPHVPVGRTVYWRLRSGDVIHSFWVPKLGGKRDVLPGRENFIWYGADSAGVYWGQCAEYCGLQHANMGMRVIAEEPQAFRDWVQEQLSPAAEPAVSLDTTEVGPEGSPRDSLIARGREVFATSACIGCHTIRGVSEVSSIGPDLTHVGSRRTLAAATLENTPENMRRWIEDPQEVKPGNLMPDTGLSDAQIEALVAYLESLK